METQLITAYSEVFGTAIVISSSFWAVLLFVRISWIFETDTDENGDSPSDFNPSRNFDDYMSLRREGWTPLQISNQAKQDY